MPLAQLYIGPGRTHEQKSALIARVTDAMKEVLGPLQQPVWVIVNEVPLTDWGVDGKPMRIPVSGER